MIYEPQSVIAPPKCISEPTLTKNISEHKRFRQDPGYISRFSVKTSVGELTPDVKEFYSDSDSEISTVYSNIKSSSKPQLFCCKCHSQGAKCSNCRCKRNGMQCMNCLPMINGKCCNSSLTSSDNTFSVLKKCSVSTDTISEKPMSMIDHKMIQAFGVPLLNSEGEWKNDMWEKIWKRTIALRGKLYTLPGGAVGRQFVSIFAAEVSLFAKGETKSEIFQSVFHLLSCSVIKTL